MPQRFSGAGGGLHQLLQFPIRPLDHLFGKKVDLNFEFSNSSVWDVYEHFIPSHLARPDFRAFPLPAAGSVFKADVPAVPTANNFTVLHDSLAKRKAEMRAQVFDSKDAIIPSEQRDI